jgi:hypothetical protein
MLRASSDEPAHLLGRDREQTERVRTEPDRARAIGMLAQHLTEVAARYAPVFDLLRAAAANGEQEIKALWETEEQQRLAGATFWIEILRAKPARHYAATRSRRSTRSGYTWHRITTPAWSPIGTGPSSDTGAG